MLTEREVQLIKGYLLHRKDQSLRFGEYYWLDNSNRVQKVYIQNILPHDDYTLYSLRYSATGKSAHVSDDFYNDGVTMSRLYDNKQDCRDMAHICYDNWEHLRKRADEEGFDDYDD